MVSIAEYLHGVDYVSDPNTLQIARHARTSVIAIVGTAPIHLVADADRPEVNEVTLVTNQLEGTRKFGADIPGYTIPSALKAIYRQGVSLALVVNVFDHEDPTHYKDVTGEVRTFDSSDRLVASQLGIYNIALKSSDANTTYTAGVDYIVEPASGEFIRIPSGAIEAEAEVQLDFRYGVPRGSRTVVTDEAQTFTTDTITVSNTPPVLDVVMTSDDGNTTYVEGTDYTVNLATGTITRIGGGSILAAADVLVDYTYGDPLGVTEADIVGDTIGGSSRTGMQELLSGYSKYGFNGRILIAPGYSTSPYVASSMRAVADRILAHAGVDAPLGTTRDEAISGRNGIGPAQNFATSSNRQANLFPHVRSVDGDIEPLSQYWAGAFARRHAEAGFWWSPSNIEVNGVGGLEYKLTSSHVDPTADIQLLNASGVVTMYGATSSSSFGTGYRIWGNRSAAFPSDTAPSNFIVIQVIEDQIRIALERAMLPYIDRPISPATISLIIQTANNYLAKLIQLNALIDGNTFFAAEDNLVSDIANGQLTVRLEHAGPPPLERLIIRGRYNENFLTRLGARTLGEAAVGIAGNQALLA